MGRILVIEDDQAILAGLVDHPEFEEYEVATATDGLAGYRAAREERHDLIVLDLMLPKLSGYEVCRKLRSEGVTTPILMLTARGEENDRVLGLDLGADDYVTKPFSLRELSARIRALLRRARPAESEALEELQFGSVLVDFRSFEAKRGGDPVEMTPKEFQVLRYLASRAGQAVTREDLLDEVWGVEHFPTNRTVDNHIATLRAKLEEDPPEPVHLKTVHGVGYKFVF
jgi:DNA-binding response OmpR family regulator